MFGLMRPQRCCSAKRTKTHRFHRMHYCGTCKIIGNQYGHSSRLFLNYDIVFLAELISELNAEDLTAWGEHYQAINKCTKMPDKGNSIPFSLEFAADANVVLAALKMDDLVKDSQQWRWKVTRFFYTQKFKKAFGKIEKWGLPKDEIWKWINLQVDRETTAIEDTQSIEQYLDYFAEPTAHLTSLIFERAGRYQSAEVCKLLKDIGYEFGQLNYILDAFEDVEQDLFKNQFNPLSRYYKATKTLKEGEFEAIRQVLLRLEAGLSTKIQGLALANPMFFIERLQSNLALRLYHKRVVPLSYKETLQLRLSSAKEFASKIVCNQEAWKASLQHFFISLSAFLFPSITIKMANQNSPFEWNWTLFFSSIFSFSSKDEILDKPIEAATPHPKKDRNCLGDWACLECCSGCSGCGNCGESTCCVMESAGSGGECCAALEGCSGCCEACGGCAECCGACSC